MWAAVEGQRKIPALASQFFYKSKHSPNERLHETLEKLKKKMDHDIKGKSKKALVVNKLPSWLALCEAS